jgi:large subunit ribosomal protein L3
MRPGLIGEKVGMTQIFDSGGMRIPVTVLKIEPCVVVQVKTVESDGYSAVLFGIKERAERRVNKPQRGFFQKQGVPAYGVLKEFRADPAECSFRIGDFVDASQFKKDDVVDVTGWSKGKGFAGAIKRHGFGGLRASHGVSIVHRSHGSCGNRTWPGKVFKNKRMAGHMGDCRVTTLNLKICSVDLSKNVVFVRGCVPGANNGIVYIRDAVRKRLV